jgi:hypothetical protein
MTSPSLSRPHRLAAAVTPGEIIEVEVEEGGAIEWRKALVARMLRGGRGRFAAIVLLKDGKRRIMIVRAGVGGQKGELNEGRGEKARAL